MLFFITLELPAGEEPEQKLKCIHYHHYHDQYVLHQQHVVLNHQKIYTKYHCDQCHEYESYHRHRILCLFYPTLTLFAPVPNLIRIIITTK